METKAPPEKANGLATYLSVLTSPTAAFTQLARTPMWGWAALIGLVLAIVGAILIQPAALHATQALQQQMLSHATADQQAQIRDSLARQNAGAGWKPYVNTAVATGLSWLLVSLIVLMAASLGGGAATFVKAWTLAINAALPGVLGIVVNALIIALRGPASVNSFSDLIALPSLGMVATNNPVLAAFLSQINPFQIWYYVVLVLGIETMLKSSRPASVTAVIVIWLLSSSLYAGLAALTTMFAK